MENLLATVRNAVRAIIIQDGKLLLLRKVDGSYSLPGGAPNTGETLQQGLLRECLEEVGCQVQIQQLLFVGDYFKERKTSPPTIRHQVEFFFNCQVPADYLPHNGKHPDKRQVDVVWLELQNLGQYALMPAGIKEPIVKMADSNPAGSVYLGTI